MVADVLMPNRNQVISSKWLNCDYSVTWIVLCTRHHLIGIKQILFDKGWEVDSLLIYMILASLYSHSHKWCSIRMKAWWRYDRKNLPHYWSFMVGTNHWCIPLIKGQYSKVLMFFSCLPEHSKTSQKTSRISPSQKTPHISPSQKTPYISPLRESRIWGVSHDTMEHTFELQMLLRNPDVHVIAQLLKPSYIWLHQLKPVGLWAQYPWYNKGPYKLFSW